MRGWITTLSWIVYWSISWFILNSTWPDVYLLCAGFVTPLACFTGAHVLDRYILGPEEKEDMDPVELVKQAWKSNDILEEK